MNATNKNLKYVNVVTRFVKTGLIHNRSVKYIQEQRK